VGSPLFAPLDRSLLPPRPSSNVWRVDIRSQGHLIKGRLSCRCPTAQRGTRLSARIPSRGSLTRSGLLSTLTLHPAEKFHGFRDSGRKRHFPPRILSHHDSQKPCARHGRPGPPLDRNGRLLGQLFATIRERRRKRNSPREFSTVQPLVHHDWLVNRPGQGVAGPGVTGDRDLSNESNRSRRPISPHRVNPGSLYQGSVSPRWEKPPVGPLSGRVANNTLVLPPSETSIGAAAPPISVLTHPGWAEFTLIGVPFSSWAR
jgi:hypothetical protein